MYKVFIVEDEHLIRDSLRHQIMTLVKQYPIVYSDEAADGELALASILDLRPDIIISDIKMPFMDGLVFAKEAKKLLPQVRIIFVSGFDDFDYAKTALQLQADDYLLKPIKNEELEQAIKTVVQHLDEQQATHQQLSKEDDLFEMEIKKNHFLNHLFKQKITISEAFLQAEELGRRFSGKQFCVLLAKTPFNQSFSDYTRFSQQLTKAYEQDDAVLFSSVSSRFIKFLLFDHDREKVLEKAYQIAQSLVHGSGEEVAVAIGPVADRFSGISLSYQKARDMLKTYGSIRKEKIISYEDDIREGELSPTNPFKTDLASRLANAGKQTIPELIAELMAPQGTVERTQMYRLFVLVELLALLKKKDSHSMPQIVQHAHDLDYLAALTHEPENYQTTLAELLPLLTQQPINPAMAKYQSVINQAKAFISEHFSDPNISLNVVAEKVHLSPAHFSTIFSQATDSTFIEYLTEQRLTLAKELLLTTNLRLSEIAFDVGYNDPNYFSFLFKKKEKISPKEYRQKNA